MTDFIPQGETIGTVKQIPIAEESPQLDTVFLTNLPAINLIRQDVADQMNNQAGRRFEDLSDRIGDLIWETSAQGASFIEIHINDPMWVLPTSGFITADNTGFLWPPIDINFPSGTECWWRLCQYRPSWDAQMTEANLILTFEDRIVSYLRQVSPADGGIKQGNPGETLGDFIKQLVDSANHVLKVDIKLVELIAPHSEDPNAPATTPNRHSVGSSLAGLGKTAVPALNKAISEMAKQLADPNVHSIAEMEARNGHLLQALDTGWPFK